MGRSFFAAGVPRYLSSKKQKCIRRRPIEAELIALSDIVGVVKLFHELVRVIIYQDNTLVVMLVTEGGGIGRTKHRARMNLVREAAQEDRICIECVSTH